jgi:hypothetical protein
MSKLVLAFGSSVLVGASLAAQAARLQSLPCPDPNFVGSFGARLALSGDCLMVGEYFDTDPNLGVTTGAVHVFERNGSGAWAHAGRVVASDGTQNDLFGIALALHGDWAIIGASGDNAPTNGTGSAYAFERSASGTWLQRQKIQPQVTGDHFGQAVALQGNRAVITSVRASPDPGHASVYERGANGQWGFVADLTANDFTGWNGFGGSVALDGDRVLIGADIDPERGSRAGAAYVFERNASGQWQQTAKLMAAWARTTASEKPSHSLETSRS